jgi:hypothetical protein
VEMVLAGWIPRKIAAGPGYLSPAPALLHAFIRFCHAEREIWPVLTEQTFAASASVRVRPHVLVEV